MHRARKKWTDGEWYNSVICFILSIIIPAGPWREAIRTTIFISDSHLELIRRNKLKIQAEIDELEFLQLQKIVHCFAYYPYDLSWSFKWNYKRGKLTIFYAVQFLAMVAFLFFCLAFFSCTYVLAQVLVWWHVPLSFQFLGFSYCSKFVIPLSFSLIHF